MQKGLGKMSSRNIPDYPYFVAPDGKADVGVLLVAPPGSFPSEILGESGVVVLTADHAVRLLGDEMQREMEE